LIAGPAKKVVRVGVLPDPSSASVRDPTERPENPCVC
jgi:hypothetical protein